VGKEGSRVTLAQTNDKIFMKLFFSLMILFPLSTLATPEALVNNLISSGFSCRVKTIAGCSYTECNGGSSFYPLPLYFAIPKKISGLRLHFHGHILNAPDTRVFEGPPSQMMTGFGLEEEICQSQEIILIPPSLGKNETYKKVFDSSLTWEKFIRGLDELLKSKVPLAHLSGHSGGGKFVALALENNVKTKKVSIYDGIYSDVTLSQIEKQLQLHDKSIVLSGVAQGSPDKYISSLLKRVELNIEKIQLNGQSFLHYWAPGFHYYRRVKNENLAHFFIVSETWSSH
jgi:hypothetical protein